MPKAYDVDVHELVAAARYSIQKTERYLDAVAARAILGGRTTNTAALEASDRVVNAALVNLSGAHDRLTRALPLELQPARQPNQDQVSA